MRTGLSVRAGNMHVRELRLLRSAGVPPGWLGGVPPPRQAALATRSNGEGTTNSSPCISTDGGRPNI